MIEVFNAVSNIAEIIEKDVFKGCQNFFSKDLSFDKIHDNIYTHCTNIIEDEFEHIKTIKGAIGKDKKQYCAINPNGRYLISYVAIDNVNLLDLNFSLGTIFGIYEESFEAKNLKAAIYITYGPTFQLVFASQSEGVMYFSHEHGEFVQQDPLTLKEKGKINSTSGIVNEWSVKHKELMESFFNEGYRLRFSNSLALDTHQILFKKGGIYSAPATALNPDGELEVVFEAFPISFIIELAGGKAVDGKGRILEIESPELHQKTPIYFGSKSEVERVIDSL